MKDHICESVDIREDGKLSTVLLCECGDQLRQAEAAMDRGQRTLSQALTDLEKAADELEKAAGINPARHPSIRLAAIEKHLPALVTELQAIAAAVRGSSRKIATPDIGVAATALSNDIEYVAAKHAERPGQ